MRLIKANMGYKCGYWQQNHLSYQNGWDKFVEEDNLDASHIQCDSSVNFRHVQIGVSFCCICIIYHLKGKHLFICNGHSLKKQYIVKLQLTAAVKTIDKVSSMINSAL